jgi:DNA repair photolyase
MSIIYVPTGKALEYSPLAANLYRGCDHGCTYCYAPSILKLSKDDFSIPKLRDKILILLEKEAPYYSGKEILLSFTCDPYQEFDVTPQITRSAIKILLKNNIKINILTKGGLRSLRDFDLLPAGSKYGATLTFANDIESLKYEPKAALPQARIRSLEVAHDIGLSTWASLEPIISPEQSLQLIDLTQKFVDVYKVGKWNHSKESNKINWRQFLIDVKNKLDQYGKQYYIKKDLAVYGD